MTGNSAPLEVQGLTKLHVSSGDSVTGGIRDASFTLAPGTFFTLLGPSGCGKTTTLRCIAGLEHPDAGSIRVGAQTFFDAAGRVFLPVNLRRIGMVFQSYAIWPHMTVFENVSFPLRVAKDRRYGRAECEALVRRALETVDLAGFESRPATRLSGGQQQRVALARAIVRQPLLLLLDEPLSNLDAALRDEMRNELKRLQRHIGITTLYVTHDQAEALEMSDLVAVIDHGRIVQMGPPREIYAHPRNAFVAKFVGSTNLLPARAVDPVVAGHAGVARLGTGEAIRCVFAEHAAAGTPVSLSVRPEVITLAGSDAVAPDDVNRLRGTIAGAGFLGNMHRYKITVGDLTVQVTTVRDQGFAPGTTVELRFPVEAAVALTG